MKKLQRSITDKQQPYIFLTTLSYTAMVTNNPLHAFGMKLQQRGISQSDFNPQLLNHPSGTPDFAAMLNVQQPLIHIDMLYQRRSAAQQIALYRHKTRRSKEYITFLVQQAYLQLQLAHEAQSVMEEAQQTVRLFMPSPTTATRRDCCKSRMC